MESGSPAAVHRVGLTGGIAAGKSVVASRLAQLGAAVIDHDELARAVVAPGTPGLEAVVAAFGAEVLTPSGELDRGALAEVVFTDPDVRARLNAIVHPLVAEAAAEREAAAVRTGSMVVVHDIPLLVETGQDDMFDEVVVVAAPAALRVRRLIDGRGMTADEARSRVFAQATEEARAAKADVVLDGSGSAAYLVEQVDQVWARWAPRLAAR